MKHPHNVSICLHHKKHTTQKQHVELRSGSCRQVARSMRDDLLRYGQWRIEAPNPDPHNERQKNLGKHMRQKKERLRACLTESHNGPPKSSSEHCGQEHASWRNLRCMRKPCRGKMLCSKTTLTKNAQQHRTNNTHRKTKLIQARNSL